MFSATCSITFSVYFSIWFQFVFQFAFSHLGEVDAQDSVIVFRRPRCKADIHKCKFCPWLPSKCKNCTFRDKTGLVKFFPFACTRILPILELPLQRGLQRGSKKVEKVQGSFSQPASFFCSKTRLVTRKMITFAFRSKSITYS